MFFVKIEILFDKTRVNFTNREQLKLHVEMPDYVNQKRTAV